jgi:hypothetical protein
VSVTHLLDTSWLVRHLRGDAAYTQTIHRLGAAQLAISAVTLADLYESVGQRSPSLLPDPSHQCRTQPSKAFDPRAGGRGGFVCLRNRCFPTRSPTPFVAGPETVPFALWCAAQHLQDYHSLAFPGATRYNGLSRQGKDLSDASVSEPPSRSGAPAAPHPRAAHWPRRLVLREWHALRTGIRGHLLLWLCPGQFSPRRVLCR